MATTPQNLIEIARRTTDQGTRVWWEFFRVNSQGISERHEIKAAACVTQGWPAETFDATAAAWAAAQAQAVCDRLDIDEPRAVRIAAACERFDQVINDEAQQQIAKAVAYLDSHPQVTATQSRNVIRPRVVDAVAAIRAITAGF